MWVQLMLQTSQVMIHKICWMKDQCVSCDQISGRPDKSFSTVTARCQVDCVIIFCKGCAHCVEVQQSSYLSLCAVVYSLIGVIVGWSVLHLLQVLCVKYILSESAVSLCWAVVLASWVELATECFAAHHSLCCYVKVYAMLLKCFSRTRKLRF